MMRHAAALGLAPGPSVAPRQKARRSSAHISSGPASGRSRSHRFTPAPPPDRPTTFPASAPAPPPLLPSKEHARPRRSVAEEGEEGFGGRRVHGGASHGSGREGPPAARRADAWGLDGGRVDAGHNGSNALKVDGGRGARVEEDGHGVEGGRGDAGHNGFNALDGAPPRGREAWGERRDDSRDGSNVERGARPPESPRGGGEWDVGVRVRTVQAVRTSWTPPGKLQADAGAISPAFKHVGALFPGGTREQAPATLDSWASTLERRSSTPPRIATFQKESTPVYEAAALQEVREEIASVVSALRDGSSGLTVAEARGRVIALRARLASLESA